MANSSFKIKGIDALDQFSKPLVVAELSGNHLQRLDVAKKMVEAAAKAGADAIKLQTYTADSMTLPLTKNEFVIRDSDSLWQGQSLYQLYEQASTPWEWHDELFALARSLGMLAFSSPFDASAVDLLESLDVPCYKIASFELVDLPLVKKVASTGKPVIMSTGMAKMAEIKEAVDTARTNGSDNIVLLKCTSAYPAPVAEVNLNTIPAMHDAFECPVGLSDHTIGVGVAIAAVALGACMIEKHFTLDRSAQGVDAAFSLEPAELAQLVQEVRSAWQALGSVCYGTSQADKNARKFRRSIYVSKAIQAGDTLSEKNISVIRPGFGLHPRYYEQILGRKVQFSISAGTPLAWRMLADETIGHAVCGESDK